MGNHPSSWLSDDEVFVVQIWEEVASSEHLHNDIDVVLILKNIMEFDYVRMLTNFKNLNLSFKKFQIFEL